MSKKQKIINFLVFASFAMQMIDMPLATLENAVISIRKPISGFFCDADPAWSIRYFQRFCGPCDFVKVETSCFYDNLACW